MTKLNKQQKTPMPYITAGPSKPKSVLDLFLLYKKQQENDEKLKKDVNLLQSVFVRFVVPGWAGPTPKGARATPKEVAAGLEFLKDVPFSRLEKASETLTQVFKNLGTPNDAQRPPRYRLNCFVNWAIEKGYLKKDATPNDQRTIEKYGFKKQYTSRHRNSEVKAGWKKPSKYALGAFEDEYVNDVIQQQFQEIQEFASRELNSISEKTHQSNDSQILRFLGWLYREKKVGSLEDLRILASIESGLPCIISVVTLKPENFGEESLNSYLLAEKKAEMKAQQVAINLIKTFKEYFQWRSILNNQKTIASDIKTVDALILVAKYAYHSQSNKDFKKNYQDIPLVCALKNLGSSLQVQNKQSRTQKHNSISWSEVIQVREDLRKEADLLRHKPQKKNPKGRKRFLSGIARANQKFLFLAFLTVVPPDRKQTLDNLTIGNTLKHGLFKNNRFIASDKLPPGEAKFYIHQGLGDYKTSKKYGEWLGELPNEVYPDGKTFYEYLERWLYYGFQDEQGNWHGLREAMVLRSGDKRIKDTPKTDPKSHNYFFVSTKGNKINSNTIYNTFQDVFYKFTNGITISPHELRHILRTHIKDLGASLQEQESAAYWMKQSLKSAEEYYTRQERETKMRPASDLMQRINQECLQEISRNNENSH